MQIGLYYFDEESQTQINAIKTSTSVKTLHPRLRHIPFQLRTMFDFNILNKNKNSNPCDSCHRAKQSRNIFPTKNNKSKELFDLIHIDTWGPYAISTCIGAKYFLTLVDDHLWST